MEHVRFPLLMTIRKVAFYMVRVETSGGKNIHEW